ncbi:MAG: hypothetical protein AB7S75_16165 [Desulfococcaceae bacterium]
MSSKPDSSAGQPPEKSWLKKLLEWIAGGAEKEKKSGGFCST